MTATLTAPETRPETPAEVLAAARAEKQVAQAAECRLLELAAEWAAMHSTASIDDAATHWAAGFGDTGIAVAGPGAPLVAEFCVAEFAAAVGLPTDVGSAYIGEAVELRHRLAGLWGRVRRGEIPAWRARRIARQTMALSADAAAYVDRHITHVAHKIGPVTTDRLIDEAIARHDPEVAERKRQEAAERRHFVIDNRRVSFDGTSRCWGELDLRDALDLEDAVAAGAQRLKEAGCEESLDVRRSMALGDLARNQTSKAGQQLVLYVHLAEQELTGEGAGIARLENTATIITIDQIREWTGNPDLAVVVKPVIDLADHDRVDAYEVPDRIAERVRLRDGHCVFPWCTRPARTCDCDHVVPWDDDGVTCPCNVAPLCRRHHRLKTHGGWRYTQLEPGTFLWTSPHQHRYLVDHEGTLDVTRHPAHRRRA
ncbi:hypothetical protein FB382_002124 [Nocardioides ginsengisegetis]|uniref:HNH nuclease domain-containing protein n=1 Tax=Nocardioides ginsengisegetis TaxID=661491 RepID=A0A7W3P9R6_9ACTN|nr:HNH endonuclease signature motif containing protein [Nocardioides ginsengisegetis]MBA8803833.1 hypothetical protein [Nocardioides ginsengisegetis]